MGLRRNDGFVSLYETGIYGAPQSRTNARRRTAKTSGHHPSMGFLELGHFG